MANSAVGKAGRNSGSLADKKGVKRVGAKEVVQCSNENCFLGFNIDVALAGSPVGHHTDRYSPNIATNKSIKTPCNQMPTTATE